MELESKRNKFPDHVLGESINKVNSHSKMNKDKVTKNPGIYVPDRNTRGTYFNECSWNIRITYFTKYGKIDIILETSLKMQNRGSCSM